MLIALGIVAVGLALALVLVTVSQRRLVAGLRELDDALGDAEPTNDRDPDATLARVRRRINRLVAAEAEESSSDGRLRLALDGITQGIVICDLAGDVVVRNAYAETFVQARHGQVLVSTAVNELLAAARSGEAGEEEVEIFGPPARSYFVHAAPVREDERLIGALAVIEETTEIQRIEAVRRDFVANLSHEVKTPIGALSLLAETLVDEEDPATIRRLSGRLQIEVDRLAVMVDDLLVLSRIEQAGIVEVDELDAGQVVTESIDRSRPVLDQRRIEISTDGVTGGIDLVADRRQLVNAIAILIDNAAKYSDEEQQIEVRAVADDDTVAFVVQDHGIGIPARDLDRIFERFYRVDRARSRETGGTGLGLSIVRHVAANHGGEVRVESREGQGSTFTLLVPREQTLAVTDVIR